jgi:predicted alpha/beta-fold hydrolase
VPNTPPLARHEPALAVAREPFRPHWSISNRHIQTIFQVCFRKASSPALERIELATDDGDFVELHFDPGLAHAPIVVIGHGLEGNQRSPYVAGLCALLRANGWGCVVLVHRSCGSRMNVGPRLYHCGDTLDLERTVRWAAERWPGRPLCVAGYSLSGNQVIKWLGGAPASVPSRVVAAAAVSPPFELRASVAAIQRALGGFYERRFLETLVPKALTKAAQFPGLLDARTIRSIRRLTHFDDAVTAVLHGFTDGEDYYEQSSCARFLASVERPLLLLASRDDPFCPPDTLPIALCAQHQWVTAEFPSRGGHVGFVEGALPQPRYWAEARVLRFFALRVAQACA